MRMTFSWWTRKKANYEDADTFVLGACRELDARRFAQALVIVTDATVAALEAPAAAYAGAGPPLADLSQTCAAKTRSGLTTAVGRHPGSNGDHIERPADADSALDSGCQRG